MLLDATIDSKVFAGGAGGPRRALADFRLALKRGEAGALIGPSGCGKTTFLRILAGIDKDFEGRVLLPEHNRLGVVFQEPRLLPWRSVFENIRIAAPQTSDAEIDTLLDSLGLSGHAAHYPGELSLGLARRVALARALAIKPDLLLLDEPLVSLDASLALELRARIARLIDETHVTTLIATHDLEDALALADKVFILTPGPSRVAATLEIATPRARMTEEAARELLGQAREAIAAAGAA